MKLNTRRQAMIAYKWFEKHPKGFDAYVAEDELNIDCRRTLIRYLKDYCFVENKSFQTIKSIVKIK
jgi:hypothetical protein